MKIKEIKEIPKEEIQSRIKESRSQLLMLKLKNQAMKIENPGVCSNIRKDIARMKTVLREQEIASI